MDLTTTHHQTGETMKSSTFKYSVSFIVYHNKGTWRTGRTVEAQNAEEAKAQIINDKEFKGQAVIITSCRRRITTT